MYKHADEQQLMGDEEVAYVMYIKFFNLFSLIKKTAEYKKNEVRIVSLLLVLFSVGLLDNTDSDK